MEANLLGREPEIGKRNDAVFAQLAELSQQRVYRLALRITRNTEDAEDVQQETMLKAHRNLEQFEGRSRFTTWISRIAINEALMYLRKRRGATHLPLEETLPPNEEALPEDGFHSGIEGPETAYSRKELRNLLTRAISSLRPAYRVVFLLRSIEHLSNTETARVLQISASAVKARMRRARMELRSYLQGAHAGTTQPHRSGMAKMPASQGQLVQPLALEGD